MRIHKPPFTKLVIAGTLALSPLAMTACGDDTAGPEEGASVGDIQEEDADVADETADGYDGVYDTDFYDGVDSYVGEEVTVSAEVNEILTPESFTIAGTDESSVESLLIVGATGSDSLEAGNPVQVTGTVEEAFDLATVEDDLGVDLDDALYEDYDAEPYIMASDVSTSVPEESD